MVRMRLLAGLMAATAGLAAWPPALASDSPVAAPALTAPATAPQVIDNKRLLTFASGETQQVLDMKLSAATHSRAIAVISSEFVSVAVIEGRVTDGLVSAGPGDVLVRKLDRMTVEHFQFDAARLSATLPPDWIGQARPALDALARHQRRRQFWGRLEQVGVNASAPAPLGVDEARRTYLAEPTIIDIRRRSMGSREAARELTALAFLKAVQARDAEAVAALIDPLPFTISSSNPDIWRETRREFARNLLADNRTTATFDRLTPEGLERYADLARFDGQDAGFLLRLSERDGATFVSAVEPRQ